MEIKCCLNLLSPIFLSPSFLSLLYGQGFSHCSTPAPGKAVIDSIIVNPVVFQSLSFLIWVGSARCSRAPPSSLWNVLSTWLGCSMPPWDPTSPGLLWWFSLVSLTFHFSEQRNEIKASKFSPWAFSLFCLYYSLDDLHQPHKFKFYAKPPKCVTLTWIYFLNFKQFI